MHNAIIHRKESIVLSAIEIISELGIQGLSTRELAKRQGVSEGTLFKHYRSKNDIIEAVLSHFSQFDSDIMNSAEIMKKSSMETINYFIKSYAEYYENYQAITSLVNAYEMLIWDERLCSKYKNIIKTRMEFLTAVIEEGQRRDEISSDIGADVLSDMILGFTHLIILKWRMDSYNFSLKESLLSALNSFSIAVLIER
jgi:AcrR family transcriptional regulator